MTLTDEEKAAARGTDPRAAAIIDRCDAMPPDVLDRLHGASPAATCTRAGAAATCRGGTRAPTHPSSPGAPTPSWWPASRSRKGTRVVLRPTRRADAQDMFLAGQVAVVTAVLSDVDGETHVAVVLEDDPAADLHDWYGRYWYFAPDELEPLPDGHGDRRDR